MVVQKFHHHVFFGLSEQFVQFQHGFARQNHVVFRQFGFQRGGCECEAVPVCGHQTQLVAFGLHEQAVQIKADVLHRHAVLHL